MKKAQEKLKQDDNFKKYKPSNFDDLSGRKFGRLLVVERASNTPSGMTRWLCVCDCGKSKVVASKHLKSGRTKSCGCLSRETTANRNLTHGMTHTRLYRIWQNIKCRCYNPNKDNFSYYGGRGILMCEEWKNCFENFYNWAILNGYDDNLQIDRIDGNDIYKPENCRWVTPIEQQNNKRNNKILFYNGKSYTIAEWSRILNIKKSSLATAIYRDKRTLEEVIKRKEALNGYGF